MFSYDYQYYLSQFQILILINLNIMDIKKHMFILSFHMKKEKHEIIIRIRDNY